MRPQAALAAVALLIAGVVSPSIGSAQGNPSTEQILKSLTPTGNLGTTRGIRVGPSAGPSAPSGGSAASQPVSAAPSVNLNVQFATGSAELTPEAIQTLGNLGRALSDRSLVSFRFRIEGHTDTVGTHEYNKDLSDRRAAAVVDYLANTFHIDRSRVQWIGLGEEVPQIKRLSHGTVACRSSISAAKARSA
jgi:OmpA-OmpF porin, OOP family